MWDKLAVIPFAFQGLFCPSRTSDTLLLALVAWILGVAFGSLVTAVILSPGLRRCIFRAIAYALHEAAPTGEHSGRVRTDRLERYRN